MKKTKKAVKHVDTEEHYKASMIMMGKKYEATGETTAEAIANLKPGIVNGRIIMTLSKGDKKKDRVLNILMAKRAFNLVGISRDINQKNLATLFGGFDV